MSNTELRISTPIVGLTFRPASGPDAPPLARWWADGSLMAWVGFPRGLDTDQTELALRLDRQCPSRELLWLVEWHGSPVGEAHHRIAGNEAEVGLKIWDESHRGRGWGRAVLSGLLAHLWSLPGVSAAVLDTWEHNSPARRCYESLGFVCLGPLPPWKDQEGRPRTAVAYRLPRPTANP